MSLPRLILPWLAAFCLALAPALPAREPSAPDAASAVYFSPNGGCTRAIVAEVAAARESVWVQAYVFTSREIVQALTEAHRRGVRVEVLLDKSNRLQRASATGLLLREGIPAFIDDCHAIAHNKIILIDRCTVITGSFNFTQAAETRNAENLLILRDPALATRYVQNWEEHRRHASPLTP